MWQDLKDGFTAILYTAGFIALAGLIYLAGLLAIIPAILYITYRIVQLNRNNPMEHTHDEHEETKYTRN